MGLETAKNWLHQCSRCSSCKYIYRNYSPSCPSGEKFWFETFWASGRVWIANALHVGKIQWSDSILNAIYACPLCGNCAAQCKQDISSHLLEIMEALRAEAVKAGIGPLEAHKAFAESIENEKNPYGELHQNRLNWLGKIEFLAQTEICFFVGCTSSYRQQEIAQATFSVLKKIGADFKVNTNEWCCGSPLLRTGQTELVEAIATHNMDIAEKISAKRIIFSCAGCYRTFKEDYPKILKRDLGIEVSHVTEYLYDLLKEGKLELTKSFPHRVTYHDPCHLGRHTGVYDPPRALLKAIPDLELIEMSRSREKAWCCGAGGGVKSGFKEWSVDIAMNRIEEAVKTNAEYLVSSCPFCNRNLADAIEKKGSDLKILDITEILNICL